MKAMELLGVDEYYSTISTWFKIIDDKNKAAGGDEKKSSDGEGATRKKLTAKK